MQLKKKLMTAGIAAAGALITSIFIPIIPCRTAPSVPNPIYKWTLCSLNPDKVSGLNHLVEYFGYTTSLRDTYILTVLLTFAAVMVFFHYTTKKKKK